MFYLITDLISPHTEIMNRIEVYGIEPNGMKIVSI